MCGFVGWLATTHGGDDRTLLAMRDAVRHRGPDDAGLYRSDDGRVAFGFRRLSIIDLTPAGHQPMANEDGTRWIVFNGEVYNFAELRPELEAKGHAFRSRTDTEVVLHAYEEWGERCVERFIGMFAFAIWDATSETLFAARDRLGIKPLYYSIRPGSLLLASELKPIIMAPGFDDSLDLGALEHYLARGYIGAPRTIFSSVRSLPPAHTLRWKPESGEAVVRRYWDPLDYWRSPPEVARSDEDWADELDELLRSAVRYRLISDVPLGAFLSGGIDSSLVAAIMRQVATSEVRTFTVGFHEQGHDEGRFAEAVARHLGTTHTTLTATYGEAQGVIPLLAMYYDEPFADSSQIPTYLVSRLTRRYVTVALSGDGGDELFCGYSNYRRMARLQYAWHAPRWIRDVVSRSSAVVKNERLARLLAGLALPDGFAYSEAAWRIWRDGEIRALVPALPPGGESGERALANGSGRTAMGVLDRMMLNDLQRYLPHDILTKVDRASMAVSLEVRVPLLDHRLVQFALGLPLRLKWRSGTSKYLLRRVLYRYVPRALVERPKHGFSVPLDHWLKHELRGLLDQYLGPDRVKRQGVFDPRAVTRHVEEFLAGRRNHEPLWSLLVFQMWFDRYVTRPVFASSLHVSSP